MNDWCFCHTSVDFTFMHFLSKIFSFWIKSNQWKQGKCLMINYFLDAQAFTFIAKVNALSTCFSTQIFKDVYRLVFDLRHMNCVIKIGNIYLYKRLILFYHALPRVVEWENFRFRPWKIDTDVLSNNVWPRWIKNISQG